MSGMLLGIPQPSQSTEDEMCQRVFSSCNLGPGMDLGHYPPGHERNRARLGNGQDRSQSPSRVIGRKGRVEQLWSAFHPKADVAAGDAKGRVSARSGLASAPESDLGQVPIPDWEQPDRPPDVS
jgi:hypothetical protein